MVRQSSRTVVLVSFASAVRLWMASRWRIPTTNERCRNMINQKQPRSPLSPHYLLRYSIVAKQRPAYYGTTHFMPSHNHQPTGNEGSPSSPERIQKKIPQKKTLKQIRHQRALHLALVIAPSPTSLTTHLPRTGQKNSIHNESQTKARQTRRRVPASPDTISTWRHFL